MLCTFVGVEEAELKLSGLGAEHKRCDGLPHTELLESGVTCLVCMSMGIEKAVSTQMDGEARQQYHHLVTHVLWSHAPEDGWRQRDPDGLFCDLLYKAFNLLASLKVLPLQLLNLPNKGA